MKYFKIIAKNNCPYCLRAKLLLIERDENFEFCTIDCSPDLWEAYKTKYNHRTVPMIFMKDTGSRIERLVGGYDDLVGYFHELQKGEKNE
jgi:glutaredoxin